ncbi:MAG: hypothetical protein ACI4VE_05710 [Clostridia bacterium]
MKKKDYKQEYNNFWKDIVENEDGTLNKDQVMRELSDYSMVMDHCSSAYSVMTDGIISKPNTLFSAVEGIFNENYFNKNTYDAYGCIDDIKTILNDCDDINELKNQIREYFDIGDSNER